MKISIITVCYNVKNTIKETFFSVINQTYENIELIVVDGGSTDGTLELLTKYNDKISNLISEPDEGIYDAMNKGIEAATGDFIMFLNANDIFYDNNVLGKVARVLNENPEAKFLFGDAEYISEDKKTSEIQTSAEITNAFDLLANNICHQSIFYNKSLFDRFGKYSSDYKIYADWDFNIKCLVENKIAAIYLPTIICKFQLGGTSSNLNSTHNYKADKNLLVTRHFNKYKFLIKVNSFLKNNFKLLYPKLKRIMLNPILATYTGQAKYRLNVKRAGLKVI